MEKSSYFIEAKFYLFSKFKDVAIYAHIDRVITFIEKVFLGDFEDNPLVCNLNPILCGLIICNLIEDIA